jgi:HAD superfamily hydrolase (TIGR01509 family)
MAAGSIRALGHWPSMPLAAILFDLDGTLVDSNDLHVRAWEEVFREAGFDISADAIRGQIGKGGDNLVPALLPDLDAPRQHALADAHGSRYKARYIGRVRPFPAARDLLARARDAGSKVVLASSASGEELDHYIDLLDASDLIDATTSKDDVESSKPDPDIFAAALAKAGAKPGEAMVVGDTPYDILAAARCGIRAVAVLSGGFPEQDLRDAGAVAIYPDVAALLAGFGESPLAP